MRPHPAVEPYRVREHPRLGSDPSDGNNGLFIVPFSYACTLQMIASDGRDWEHVSVVPVHPKNHRLLYRTPSWEEMHFAKQLWWSDEETVMQLHPPKRLYRSAHDYCLHLWKPIGIELPLPDPIMVAPEGVKVGL